MQSFLEPEGLYNPALRFAFTNITSEPFTSKWGGVPINVSSLETIEISNNTPIPGAGHALAVKMTKELVDKIMIDDVKMDELKANTPYFRSPKGPSLGVPAARKVWEDKILRELNSDEESPSIIAMRKRLLSEIESGNNEKRSTEPPMIPTSLDSFATIQQSNHKVKVEKEPAQTVSIKGKV